MRILKAEGAWNLLIIIKYIVHSRERNLKGIRFKCFILFQKIMFIFTRKHTGLRVLRKRPSFHLIRSMSCLSGHQLESCVSWTNPPPPDGFDMTIMSKVWIDSSNILAITNNHHAPNRYSKAYAIKDNICKLYVCDSPWLTRYLLLSITTTVTSWPEEKSK